MRKTVVALFNTELQALSAATQLRCSGFNIRTIDIADGRQSQHNSKDDGSLWNFLKTLFTYNTIKAERWLYAAQRAFIVSVITYSGERAMRAAAILDSSGAVDVEEDFHKYFYGKEYRDDTDYQKESILSEKGSFIIEGSAQIAEVCPCYYRDDKDFETDHKRFGDEFSNSQNEKTSASISKESVVEIQFVQAPMRSLVIEIPKAAMKFLGARFSKNVRLA